jgi:hypothetical protein
MGLVQSERFGREENHESARIGTNFHESIHVCSREFAMHLVAAGRSEGGVAQGAEVAGAEFGFAIGVATPAVSRKPELAKLRSCFGIPALK